MQRAGAELPVLIAQDGPLEGQRWYLEQTMTVGRDPDCDIVINDRQISRYHARLTPDERGVLLEDLGSKNGTYCNGVRLEEPYLLSDGDLLQISLVQHFVFLSSDATMPLSFDISALPRQTKASAPARLVIDQHSRRVWLADQELVPPLSLPQFRLLQTLYEHAGQVVERQQLINAIWGEDEAIGVSEQAFDALVRRLRDRLALIDPQHNFIVTIRGHGLRLENIQ